MSERNLSRYEQRQLSTKTIWPDSPPYKPFKRKEKKRKHAEEGDSTYQQGTFDLPKDESEEEIIGPLPSMMELPNEEPEKEEISNVYGYSKKELEAFQRAGYVMTGTRQIDGVEIVKITTDTMATATDKKPKGKQQKPAYVPNKAFSDNKVLAEFKEMLQNRNKR